VRKEAKAKGDLARKLLEEKDKEITYLRTASSSLDASQTQLQPSAPAGSQQGAGAVVPGSQGVEAVEEVKTATEPASSTPRGR
jgi:hypothetical protein